MATAAEIAAAKAAGFVAPTGSDMIRDGDNARAVRLVGVGILRIGRWQSGLRRAGARGGTQHCQGHEDASVLHRIISAVQR